MPQSRSHKTQTRNYKREYLNYQGKPKQIHNRSLRNQARRKYESVHGNLSGSTDVDHINPLIKGGSNVLGNTRAISAHRNRSFNRTKNARMK